MCVKLFSQITRPDTTKSVIMLWILREMRCKCLNVDYSLLCNCSLLLTNLLLILWKSWKCNSMQSAVSTIFYTSGQNRKLWWKFRWTSEIHFLFVVSPLPGLHLLSLSVGMTEKESAGNPVSGKITQYPCVLEVQPQNHRVEEGKKNKKSLSLHKKYIFVMLLCPPTKNQCLFFKHGIRF